jgi:hypothetical protein
MPSEPQACRRQITGTSARVADGVCLSSGKQRDDDGNNVRYRGEDSLSHLSGLMLLDAVARQGDAVARETEHLTPLASDAHVNGPTRLVLRNWLRAPTHVTKMQSAVTPATIGRLFITPRSRRY